MRVIACAVPATSTIGASVVGPSTRATISTGPGAGTWRGSCGRVTSRRSAGDRIWTCGKDMPIGRKVQLGTRWWTLTML